MKSELIPDPLARCDPLARHKRIPDPLAIRCKTIPNPLARSKIISNLLASHKLILIP